MRRSRRLPHPLQTLTTTLIDACHMHVLSMAIYYTLASNSKRAERGSRARLGSSCANIVGCGTMIGSTCATTHRLGARIEAWGRRAAHGGRNEPALRFAGCSCASLELGAPRLAVRRAPCGGTLLPACREL